VEKKAKGVEKNDEFKMKTKVTKDIARLKKLLIAKAKRKGLYENFGQKEVGKLKDKFPTGYMGEERLNMDEIQKFSEWAMSVSDKDLQ